MHRGDILRQQREIEARIEATRAAILKAQPGSEEWRKLRQTVVFLQSKLGLEEFQ